MGATTGLTHTDYTPISCSAYDVLESSAVLEHDLELHLNDSSIVHGRIQDVFAKGAEEYCIVRTRGKQLTEPIRLDAIVRIIDRTTRSEYTTNAC